MTSTDATEARALAVDAQLLRGVRRRLVLWSGGATLVVLVVLAALLYATVARSLEARGERVLHARAALVRDLLTRTDPEEAETEFTFGSDAFVMVLDRRGRPIPRLAALRIPPGLPDLASLAAADRPGGIDLREGRARDVPIRVLTERIDLPRRSVFVQVVQDRTAEQRTLEVMLTVLLVGGGIAVAVASAVGTVYARRALDPIRDSLRNQRIALRRQREFAADASHELRTPLSVLRSSVEYLKRHGDGRAGAARDALEDIDAEVTHLASLVDDLLLLARSDSGAVSLARLPVDLGDVAAEGASSLAQPAAEKGVRLDVRPAAAVVLGDATRLRQVVRILVDNAIRHTPAGGDVEVRIEPRATAVTLAVSDRGPGVRPEDRARIFERFWRAPGAPPGGTGLGLAIARWIVEQHGGRIEVADRASGGAVFRVELPLEVGRG